MALYTSANLLYSASSPVSTEMDDHLWVYPGQPSSDAEDVDKGGHCLEAPECQRPVLWEKSNLIV